MPAETPIRTCVGCRSRRPQAELVRIHMDSAGRVAANRSGSGRGAWLCADTTGKCLAAAVDQKAFDRAFRASPKRSSVDQLTSRWPRA